MHYAPILIPTLCRYEHFVRCIESLKRNTWAKYTDVYVALDYPAKEEHKEGYNKICNYLNGEFKEFQNFFVIKREKNYGAAKNMATLRNDIFNKYDSFIRTDDDCEFAPCFLEYIDKCLEKYKDDESVVGVTGYSYPVEWVMDRYCNAFKNSAIFPMWGTAFWKNKFISMQKEIESGYIKKQFLAGRVNRKNMTDARYVEAVGGALKEQKDNLLFKMSDVALGCYIQLEHKYIVTPKLSLVRNHGFDGSGLYCQDTSVGENKKLDATTYDYTKQSIDLKNQMDLVFDKECRMKDNYAVINKFDKRSMKRIVKSTIGGYVRKMVYIVGGGK